MIIAVTSKDDSVQSVINWMKIGVCDYLIKPIRPEDLRFIFKHVVKKMQVGKRVESEEKATAEKSSSVGDSTIRNPNKRKRSMFIDGQVGEKDQDHVRDSTTKKRRVVWDNELKKKFLDAMEDLGPGSESHTLGLIILDLFYPYIYMNSVILCRSCSQENFREDECCWHDSRKCSQPSPGNLSSTTNHGLT